MDLLLASKLVLGSFSASTITAFLLCYFNKTPFFNPKHDTHQFYTHMKQVALSTTTVLVQSILVGSFFVKSVMDDKPHTIYQNIDNMLRYSIIVELFYYIYHRLAHTKPYYKSIHSMHHTNIEVYPFDTFYMTRLDAFFLISALSVPLFFVKMNYFEHLLIVYVYGTAAYLEHSNLLFTHHKIHHTLLLYNYCIVNPIFDILAGTYKHG
jgi:sterol desaturase/sphingolipid hydroxylase (fatty acid hydroxylase superfamily)